MEWIKVEDKLPENTATEESADVLIFSSDGDMIISYYWHGVFYDTELSIRIIAPTHWMHLPKPPTPCTN